jgi:hypothetical protein
VPEGWEQRSPDEVVVAVIVPAGSMNWREAMVVDDPW